jgi:predicted hydrolase (HD superfamily)
LLAGSILKSPEGEKKRGNVERETGFEPATSTLARLHSTTELFPLDGPFFKPIALGLSSTFCIERLDPFHFFGYQNHTQHDLTVAHFMITERIAMPETTPTRQAAFALLCQYNQSDSLIKHALAVEAVMRHFARNRGQDEEKWGIIGLIHDLDYEQFPEQHCRKSQEILAAAGWPADYIRAVVSHGWGICSDIEPETEMEKLLYAADELTGLVTTTALVRPSKSVLDLTAKSVKKKWKDKRFAAGVDRSIIEKGAAMLGMDLNDLITETIQGMKAAAEAIGLKGSC